MRKINLDECELEYSAKQQELDDILYGISIQRHSEWNNGLLVIALHDDECEELIKKYHEWIDLLHSMYDRTQKRVEWDNDSLSDLSIICIKD